MRTSRANPEQALHGGTSSRTFLACKATFVTLLWRSSIWRSPPGTAKATTRRWRVGPCSCVWTPRAALHISPRSCAIALLLCRGK